MRALRAIYAISRADLIERIRRYGTLITLGLTIYLTYLALPPETASYLSFSIAHVRGIYNSAWVGGVVAIFGVFIFSIPALYLVKGAVERDRLTRVGQIIATTPMVKWHYTAGKFLSNLVFLATLAGIAMVGAIGIQLLRGEVLRIELRGFLGPYLLITLPMMAVVAAIAVLGESLEGWPLGLGRRAGPLLLGFAMIATGGVLTEQMPYLFEGGVPAKQIPLDVTGVPIIFHHMWSAGSRQTPGMPGGLLIATLPNGMNVSIAKAADGLPGGRPGSEGFEFRTFVWEGIAWTASDVAGRLLWFVVAFGIASLAALPFDRFDPSGPLVPAAERARGPSEHAEPLTASSSLSAGTATVGSLAVARRASGLTAFGRIVLAELRLACHGVRWWWFAVAGALWLGGLLAPLVPVRSILLPLAWAWLLPLWSPMGSREARHNTRGMVLAARLPLRRQLLACWTAGLAVTILAGSGAGLRLAYGAQWSALVAWGVAALFIPSLALALGVWTGSSKAFEVVYLILWYLGPWSKIPYLDFVGATEASTTIGMPLAYGALGAALLGAAMIGRRWQLRA